MEPDRSRGLAPALYERCGAALLLLFTAGVAALVAHVCIDVLGDYLVVHDTYDKVDHGSRSAMGCAVLMTLVIVTFIAVCEMLARVSDAGYAYRHLRALVPRNAWRFFAAVAACSLALVVAMEAADLSLAGTPIEDLGDLLGGSLLLGLASTLVVACTVAAGVLRIARWLSGAAVRVARALTAWVLVRAARPSTQPTLTRGRRRYAKLVAAVAVSASRRGPPSLA